MRKGGNSMRKIEKRTHRGFTLIELVIVITILAILAAVAIPAFSNLTVQARNASTQGAIGALRSALAVYRANEFAGGRAGSYPTIAASVFANPPSVMDGNVIPENPWARFAANTSPASIVAAPAGSATRATSGAVAGWAYDAGTGLIYANTAATTAGTTENNY